MKRDEAERRIAELEATAAHSRGRRGPDDR